ncbi:MAG: methylenetetrahydrofolate--tRNA-(uracil(54)-C(5))-methyltransferase (FADH(2)-oxidizing) TrmFO [Oscillospiraceae bacterium]|nr:methylenetetrahydrofolate--tRNA-(uracil(54)-C(5))-methyltransferase (FADH(2)-oxidizing) TrmFO [Oscillospiraceae bacterium]
MNDCLVIGGGLAGVEAAAQLSKAGYKVTLAEMKPVRFSPAHKSENLAELVCSNSLKAERLASAAGLLKHEMSMLGSVCVEAAMQCRVPAGGALAVDRDLFSQIITERIEHDPHITVLREEITEIPTDRPVIVAAGPLASEALSESIRGLCGGFLSFFDAAAPIVTAESIDMDSAFGASRYDRGGDEDYINCPMNKAEYEAFYEALVSAERAQLHEFEKGRDIYEGCMPIEVMAQRGADTIRYGPLKPVGLRDPHTGHRPWAVLQLRRENAAGTLYNLVGFQTNLKFSEQKRVFSMIPALRHAEFVRYGVMHRNTFIQSPGILDADFSMKAHPLIYFAGQITGVEGYMESAASGLLAGLNLARRLAGKAPFVPPEQTMLGALCRHVSASQSKNFQPMGANFGILPQLPQKIRDKKLRYEAIAARGVQAMEQAIAEI